MPEELKSLLLLVGRDETGEPVVLPPGDLPAFLEIEASDWLQAWAKGNLLPLNHDLRVAVMNRVIDAQVFLTSAGPVPLSATGESRRQIISALLVDFAAPLQRFRKLLAAEQRRK